MHLSHPLCISLCQIVIDRDNVHAFSLQRIQIGGQQRSLCLSFTGSHLCDSSLMQNDTTD